MTHQRWKPERRSEDTHTAQTALLFLLTSSPVEFTAIVNQDFSIRFHLTEVLVCPHHTPHTLRTSTTPWFCGYKRHTLFTCCEPKYKFNESQKLTDEKRPSHADSSRRDSPLISASRLLERGHKLALDEKPRIQCKNGNTILLERTGSLFAVRLWIQKGFHRQG